MTGRGWRDVYSWVRRRKRGRLQPVTVLLLLMTALSLSACRALSPWHGIIKVAVVAPYSGPLTAEGLSILAGARLAVDEIDQRGGIGGYRVEIVATDEGSASAPEDVVADPDVVAVVGHVASDTTRVARRYRVAGLIWLAAQPVDRNSGSYPLVAGPDAMSRALRRYLASAHDAPTNSPERVVAACRAALIGSGVVVEDGERDVICAGTADRLEMALRRATVNRVVCVAAWCNTPALAGWAADDGFDYIVPLAAPPADPAAWSRFAQRMAGAAPVLTAAALGYDGVKIVGDAVGRAARRGDPTRQMVAREVLSTATTGVLNTYGPEGPERSVVEIRRSGGPGAATFVFPVEETP